MLSGLVCPDKTRERAHKRSSKMPKMKTKSAAKKRFKITATGKVLAQPQASAMA